MSGRRCGTPASLIFGNALKRMSAIAAAYEAGVERFAFDSDSELDKLIAAAPRQRRFLPCAE